MKKLFAMPLFILSITADANTYIKFGYGINSVKTDDTSVFSDNVHLTPEGTDNTWQVTAGYQITDDFAIETAFQQFEKSASQKKIVESPNVANNFTETKYSWNSNIQANRLSIKSLYLHRFQNELQLNTGIGLTLTQYDLSSSTSVAKESLFIDQEQNLNSIPEITSPDNRSEVKVGATATIGLDYPIWQNVTVGADANFSVDGVTSTLQLLGTVGYRF